MLNRSRTARRPIKLSAAAITAGALLSLALVTGCSSESGNTSCSLDACTITFKQGVNASAKVLGVEAKLLASGGDKVTVEVAGQQMSLTVGQPATEVGGLAVSLDSLTESQAVVRVARK